MLGAGFPLVAFLQLVRVYAQSIRKIAEAEVRLFHLYVHEPLIREGVAALEMAEEMEGLASRPAAADRRPLIEYIHHRYLRFYIEQDVVGHMEADLGGAARSSAGCTMAFCFVDLTGFTRYTEEEGDEEALDLVERFVETVEATLPAEATDREDDRRRGDDRLARPGDADRVGGRLPDPVPTSARSRGSGSTTARAVYRDGDYFGSEVNLTHRVVARALGGEVLVTDARSPRRSASPTYLEFDPIGEVELKGFPEPIELFVVRAREPRRASDRAPGREAGIRVRRGVRSQA